MIINIKQKELDKIPYSAQAKLSALNRHPATFINLVTNINYDDLTDMQITEVVGKIRDAILKTASN